MDRPTNSEEENAERQKAFIILKTFRSVIVLMIGLVFFVFNVLLSNCSSSNIPSAPCSNCLYPISSTGAIKLPGKSIILMGGGSDHYGFLDSNFKLLDYSNSSIQASLFNGKNQPSQSNNYLEGFQSPIFCRYDSSIVFLDLSDDPPNMYELDILTWSWSNLTFNGVPPLARQRYAKTCTESKIYIHSGIAFKSSNDSDDDFGFWEYDLKNKAWSVLPNVPFLWGHAIGVLGSDLFALGGNTIFNGNTIANTDIWKFDLNETKWDIISTKFYGGGTITALNDSLIIYGGPVSSSLYEYAKKGWVLTRLYKEKESWITEFIDLQESDKYNRLGHTSVYDKDYNLIINLGGSDYQGSSEDEGKYTFASIFDLNILKFRK